jgi:hypothetical protein
MIFCHVSLVALRLVVLNCGCFMSW